MKAGWEIKALEKCLKRFPIAAKIPKKQFLAKGAYPILSQEANFINGYWEDESALNRLSSPVVLFGDHTQVLKYIDFDFVVGADGVKILAPEEGLDAKFLMYFIEANPFPSLGYARHFRHVKSLPIPLPPLEEQKRIVAILDAAFEGLTLARTHVKTNLQNARELFHATLASYFNPAQNPSLKQDQFDKVCVLQRGFDLPKRLRTQGQYDLVTSSGASDTHNEFKVEGPGVATGRSGSIGSVFYIEGNFWPLNTALYIKDFFGNSPKYIWYFLRAFDLERFASGAGVPTLNRNHVHEEVVYISKDLNEQREVVEKLDQLEATIFELAAFYDTKLQDLDDLRQSLLQKAFAGELT